MFTGTTGPEEIVAAVDRATVYFRLCPNRIWGVAGSLPGREKNLPLLIPPAEALGQPSEPHEDHGRCTFDLCEYSRRDFTSVPQRHEPSYCKGESCTLLVRRFPRGVLEQAILQTSSERGSSTAWKLEGVKMIEPYQPYMAISHVWSDGTGVGAWSVGDVNKCLYAFFKRVAKRFQCEGIWWDTICIPQSKAARTKAIPRIQNNYEDATVTLVHDCFLRNWTWTDAGSACFAIVMSPWFSRGWTSLELSRSRKVKVIFRGPRVGSVLIKDLDEDILAPVRDFPDDHRYGQLAAKAIANLRSPKITNFNNLLSILGPRYTSWPRDMAVISGLLVGVDVTGATQQVLYQRILTKLGTVSHGHLFHNSATMSPGFTWCPTSILDLPVTANPDTELNTVGLSIEENGVAVGWWKAAPVTSIPEETYIWKDTHPLIEARLRLALMDKDKHVLLMEPHAVSISRALLVRVMRKKVQQAGVPCRFIGSVYFQPSQVRGTQFFSSQKLCEGPKSLTGVNVRIGDIEGAEDIGGHAWNQLVYRSDHPESAWGHGALNIGIKRELAESDETPSNKRINTNKDAARALLQASANGDEEEVLRLLKEGTNTDTRDKSGQTPLHCATWRGHVEVVEHLIELGKAGGTIRDKLGRQAIHLAAERGSKQIVELLLDGADVNHRCNSEQTVLHRAAWGGSANVIDVLLAKTDSDINARDERGRTALLIAAEMGYTALVEKLLRSGANPNIQSYIERTPLHEAAIKGHTLIIKSLLQYKADPNIEDARQRLPLHWAVRYQHEEAVRLLVLFSDLVVRDGKHKTALFMAVKKRHIPIISLIMKQNGDLPARDPVEKLSLHQAVRNRDVQTLRCLLRCSNPNIQDAGGRTALCLAVQKRYTSMVKLLLKARADPSIQDSKMNTPIHLAMTNGDVAAVKALLEHCDIDSGPLLLFAASLGHVDVIAHLLEIGNVDGRATSVNAEGQTPLMLAVMNGHEEAVTLLLEKCQADMDRKDRNGGTPLSEAARRGFRSMAVLFVEAGSAAINLEADSYGQTLLHWAAEGGSIDAVKSLITAGAGIDVRDDDGRTPLSWAAGGGREDIVALLLGSRCNGVPLSQRLEGDHQAVGLEAVADLYALDNTDRTALSWAAGNGHEAVVRQILDAHVYSSLPGSTREPLDWATKIGHESIFRLLLHIAINGDIQNFDFKLGKSLFNLAAENGHEAILEQLYALDVKQETWPPCGSALRSAAKNGHVAVVKLITARNNIYPYEGREFLSNEDIREALRLAAENGRGAAFEDLLPRDEELRIGQGEALLLKAAEAGHGDVVRHILARKEVNPNHTDLNGRTALFLAAGNGHDSTVKRLLSRPDVSPNITDKNGQTPLSVAAEKGHATTVKEFLGREDVNITLADWRGAPPLVFAAENRQKAIVKELLAAEGLDLKRDLGLTRRPTFVDASVYSDDSVSFDDKNSSDSQESSHLWESSDDNMYTHNRMTGICKAVLDLYESDGEERIVRRRYIIPKEEDSD